MADITVRCPNPDCRQAFRLDESTVGKRARCKKCGTRFVIERPAGTGAGGAEDDAPAVWDVGDVILDLYEVRQVHTGGGMGLVYRVHHRNWNTDLAVKSPRPESFRTERQKENFERECETWVNLGLHPHVVSCYYVRRLGGVPRVFAEYVEGGSLREWIRDGRLYEGGREQALKRILDVAIQTAWGLHYAHEQGLVHQDVKPANVMVTEGVTAKVTDFGLARARVGAEEAEAPGSAAPEVTYGGMTPAYCSPEQARREKLTRATDIWSWGLSVLEMFAGGVTWRSGTTAARSLERRLAAAPEDPALPRMTDGLAYLLAKCFRARPEDRPANMEEVAQAVQGLYRDSLAEAYPRERPKASDLLADGLSNSGVSMLDLGRPAEPLFEQALRADPNHVQANFNHGLLLWRTGRTSDADLLARLERAGAAGDDGLAAYCKGIVHLERCDVSSAVQALRKAAGKGIPEADSALTIAEARLDRDARLVRVMPTAGQVHCLAVSRDGRWALSGEEDAVVALSAGGNSALRLWDLTTGQCAKSIEGIGMTPRAVFLSSTGRRAVTGHVGGALVLRDLTGVPKSRLLGRHSNSVLSVAVTGDGRWVLSGGVDSSTFRGEVRLWDLKALRCVRSFTCHNDMATSVALSGNGRLGLTGGSADHLLYLWDLLQGTRLREFRGHSAGITAVALSTDGRRAVSSSHDGDLRLWDPQTGACLRVMEGHTRGVDSMCLSPDGQWALSGGSDGTVRFWETRSGRCLRTLDGRNSTVGAVALSGEAGLAISSGWGGDVRVWDLRPLLEQQGVEARSLVSRVSVSAAQVEEQRRFDELIRRAREAMSSGRLDQGLDLARQARDVPGRGRSAAALQMWADLSSGCRRVGLRGGWNARVLEGCGDSVTCLSLSRDGQRVVSGSVDRTVRIWDLNAASCTRLLEGHSDEVHSVAWSGDAGWIISGGSDGTACLWDAESGQLLKGLEHGDLIRAVALSDNGQLAMSAGGWRKYNKERLLIRLWDTATGKCTRTLKGHTDEISDAALSADGQRAVSASRDGTVRLWDCMRGRCLNKLEGHTDSVGCVCLSADGRWVLSGGGGGGEDCSLRLWELAGGRCAQVLEGHPSSVTCVAISADGRWAISGDYDGTLKVWDFAQKRCVADLGHSGQAVLSVAFGPEERWALSAGDDKKITLWRLDWELEAPGP